MSLWLLSGWAPPGTPAGRFSLLKLAQISVSLCLSVCEGLERVCSRLLSGSPFPTLGQRCESRFSQRYAAGTSGQGTAKLSFCGKGHPLLLHWCQAGGWAQPPHALLRPQTSRAAPPPPQGHPRTPGTQEQQERLARTGIFFFSLKVCTLLPTSLFPSLPGPGNCFSTQFSMSSNFLFLF